MGFNQREEIRGYLRSNGILDLKGRRQLTAVVRLAAEIPWGEGRTIEEALLTKKVGTCTGKHLVLQACLDELGIRNRPVVCTFRWGEQPIKYPEHLRVILKEGEWEHGHNFLQILMGDSYVDVDITWNGRLKPYGFKVLPQDWDGKMPFAGVDNIVRRWGGAEVGALKKELIGSLTPELVDRRERFLKGFIGWVESINRIKR